MAFDVYPKPPNNRQTLNIPAGASTITTIVNEQRSSETPPVMYIRVSSIDGIVPEPVFSLQTGTGAWVPVPSGAVIPPQGIWNVPYAMGTPQINYVGDSYIYPENNNVYLIKVLLFLSSTQPSWQLKIDNAGGPARKFVFVVAQSDLESQQPWIDMSTTLIDKPPFEVLVNETGQFNVRIFNRGTGALTGLGGTLAGTDAASFTFAPPVTTINPNDLLDVPLTLAAIDGPQAVTATLTVTSNDQPPAATTPPTPGHNNLVVISGQVEQLEIAFMLDASGSMAFAPDGSSVIKVNRNATRWGLLKTAAQAALTALGQHGNGKGKFGVGMYPDITPFPADPSAAYSGPFPVNSPSAADFQALTDISPANVKAVADANTGTLEQHFVREWGAATPMGAGIHHAIGDKAGGIPWGYFGSLSPGKDFNRRWVILMTDGNQNSGELPSDFFASFTPKRIRVLTIGYGTTTATLEPVNTALLTDIANAGYQGSAAADFHPVTALEDPSLTTAFIKSVLLTALQFDTATDPGGVLTSANPTVSRQVSITQYDQKLSFIVAWTTYDAERLQVTVRTPLGEILEGPGNGYTVDTNPRFRMLTFDQDFLRNIADPGKPRYGTWTLTITLNQIQIQILEGRRTGSEGQSIDNEAYNYQVAVGSRLRLQIEPNQTSFAPGDTIRLSAFPTLDWQGISNAVVTLSRTIPSAGHLNWIASSTITAEEYNRVADEQRKNPDIGSLGIKKIALAIKGQKFTPFGNSDVVNMVDPGGKGVYIAETTNTSVPGSYEFLITAVGTLPDGTLFRREKNVNIEVVVRPDPAFTLFHVEYAVLAQTGQTKATMTVWPLDRYRNVVLIDPKFDPSLVFTATGGDFEAPIVDNHDGSYTRTLIYPTGQVPSVGVIVGGVNVVPKVPVVNVSGLTFVDKVFAFNLGREATPGANKHRDPAACLGNFTTKTSPGFVALGGGGSLVVGISGHSMVGRGGNDDITIFVASDEEPRPYSVEVRHEDDDDDWLEIGRSPGVTQSFGLHYHSRNLEVRAIRIRDQSLRLRNNDGTPSASPGVSILAVGAEHVEREDFDGDDQLLAWLKKLGHL
jgi:hypothetical protein